MIMALVVIVVGILLLWAISAWLTKRHNDRVVTDSGGVVELGEATRLAAQFDRGDGMPIYFSDVSGNDERSVYLIHESGPSGEGWTAFSARVPDEDAACQWQWNADEERFDASCDPDRHAPADADGLEQYPVEVVGGKLRVDLRSALPAASPADDSRR